MIPAGAIRRKVIIHAFLDAGAVSPDTAKSLKEVGVIKGLGIKFEQLIDRGILVPCANEKYYVDESKL